MKSAAAKILILVMALSLLTFAACTNDTASSGEVRSRSETPTAQSETKDEPLYSSQPLPYEIGQVSVVSNNAKCEPYIHMSSAQVVIDGRVIDGVGKFLSLEDVSKSLPEIQYADDFQVIVEGEDAEIPAYSLYNDKFENLYSYQNDLSIPSEAGIYLLLVKVTWSNVKMNPQYREYTLNEYIFKVKV